ncbi:MAG: hypothetical protein BroJett011_33870 [Chloroflexota bacterium]|nr:MAG: hypothetical protein BroJett011_33870 [Chloroflexota bacterium]
MKRPITLTVAPPETEQEKEALERFMTDDPSLLLARIMDVHANYLTKNPAKINQELLAALEELTPAMPPKDAPCHYGLVPQEECANCQRIAKAHAAIARAKG